MSDAARAFGDATIEVAGVLDVVARDAARLVNGSCAVLLASDDGRTLVPAALDDPDPDALVRVREALSEPLLVEVQRLLRHVAQTGAPVLIADVDWLRPPRASPRLVGFARDVGIHTLLVAPLRAGNRSIGHLVLARSRASIPSFDADDLAFATALGAEAALAITTSRLLADLSRERAERARTIDHLVAIADASRDFSTAGADVAGLLEVVARRLGALLGDSCMIRVISDDGAWIEPTGAAYHCDDALLDATRAIMSTSRQRVGEGISGRVAASGDPLFTPLIDPAAYVASSEPRYRAYLERLRVVSAMTLPLLCRGEVVGIANLMRGAPSLPYTEDDFAVARSIAEHAALAIGNARAREAERVARDHAEAFRRDRDAAQKYRELAEIVEASDDAIIGKTLEGVVTSWNPGARQLFGYAADEMVGRPITLLIPPGREDEEPMILDALARGQVKRFDTVRRRKDGALVDVSVTSSPVHDATGRVVGISKVARDITARRRSEVALARARDAAEAANHELEAFSYSVAHDLRAPLRGMIGSARVLCARYGASLDAEGRDWLEEIVQNARKMGDRIDALLLLARLTRGDLETARVDLSALVRDEAERLRAAEPDRVVRFTVEDGVQADVDPRLARALVENLIANAWKFTSKVALAIIEFGRVAGDAGRPLYVRDNGAGFDMAFAGKLFAPFQRLHSAADFAGTGIGLAIVQRIVHRHGGRIWAEGAVGAGATFYFTLPERVVGAAG